MSAASKQQCWGCRWRRVQCDSNKPTCSKCTKAGLDCPGYSVTKPLRWRHRITRSKRIKPTVPGPAPAPDELDVAPSHVVIDALTYYNTKVAPDLAADGSSYLYTIDISKWHVFNTSKRHLTLCLVTLHRAVLEYGDVKHNQALFHYHQACAAEILNHKINTLGQMGPDPELFEDVSLFFFSQIQASAYGAWRAHLRAARTLFNLWGIDALMGNPDYEFFLCHLVLADIFGAAMAPASHISVEDISQHTTYLELLLGKFNVDVCSTMVPIPEAIVRATAAINILRATQKVQDKPSAPEADTHNLSVDTIKTRLRNFDPEAWAVHRPHHSPCQTTGWTLLATCYQAATLLYLSMTLDTPALPHDEEGEGNTPSTRLTASIRHLYELRNTGGVHYKYILWPMVVCGIEAVLRRDAARLRFLCGLLEQTTRDLGTLSMREAALFLDQLWVRCVGREAVMDAEGARLDWDVVFESAPLFLM